MSWKEAYRVRAGIVGSNIKSAMKDQTEASAAISAAQMAQAGFRKDIKKSTVPLKQPEKTESEQINDALEATIEKGGFEGFLASVGKVAETPGIKQTLNVLSTGTYASANTADNILDAVNNISDGNARGVSDLLMAPITGIGQGLNAGIGQNRKDATTYSEVMDSMADTINRGKKEGDEGWIDKESSEAKWGKGLGGFAADVALDPLTYLTLGIAPAVTGAVRGARQGSKTAKGIAEEAIRKAPQNAEVVPPKSTLNFDEIANNPKGKLRTALQESSKDHRSWKEGRAKYKADKKDIRARRKEENNGTVDGEFVGIKIADQEAEKAARVGAVAASHQDELERQLQAEIDSGAPARTADSIKEEVVKDRIAEATPIKLDDLPVVKATEEAAVKVAPEPNNLAQIFEEANAVALAEPKAPTGLAARMRSIDGKNVEIIPRATETPKPSGPTGLAARMKIVEGKGVEITPAKPATMAQEVKAAVEQAPVMAPKLPNSLVANQAKVIQALEQQWTKPKYGRPGVRKELENPGKPTVFKQVAASELARPEIAAKYGVDHTLYADPATHTFKVASEGTPARGKGTREYSGGKLESQANKDKRKAQANTATAKKNSRLKAAVKEDKSADNAPHLSDDKYGTLVDSTGQPTKLTTENFDEFIDPDEFDNFVGEFIESHGDILLKVKTSTMESSMKFSAVAANINKAIDASKGSPTADLYINQNLHLFMPLLDDVVVKDLKAFEADKAAFAAGATKATDDVDEVVPGEAVDDLENLFEDLSVTYPRMIDVEEANPNVWSPERAIALGIKAGDEHLSPAEISVLNVNMTNAEIRKKIMGTDKMAKSDMDMLRALTGKTDPKEIADEFVKLRHYHSKALKDAEKPAKVLRETKEQEVARFQSMEESVKPIKATDEHIDSIKAETTDLAEQFVKSPVAFDEPYQMRLRTANYHMALKDTTHGIGDETLIKIVNPETGNVAKAAINDYAHSAVKSALAVQLKEAPHLTDGGMRTLTTDITTGGAWSPKIWGSDSQIALHESIIKAMVEQINAKALPWAISKKTGKVYGPNATANRKFYMSILKVADAELRAAGVEPFLNHIDNIPGKASTNVSMYDMFAALDENGMAVRILDQHVFGRPSESFNLTQMQGAFESLLRLRNTGASEKYIRTQIKAQLIVSRAGAGRPIANDIAATENTARRLGYKIDTNESLKGLGAKEAVRTAKRLDAVDADKIVDALLDPGVYRSLSYRQMINRAAHNSSLGAHVAAYADRMVERLYQVADMIGPGAALKAFNDEAKALRAGLSAEDYAKGAEALKLKLTETVSEVERVGIATATKRAEMATVKPPVTKAADKASNTGKELALYVPRPSHITDAKPVAPARTFVVNSAGQVEARAYKAQQAVNKTHVDDAKAVEAEVAATPKPDNVEPFEMYAAEIATAAIKKMHPIQRLTNPRLGLSSDVYRAVNSGMHSIARQQAHFHQTLSMHLEKYSAATLRTDFEDLQKMARNTDEKTPFVLADTASDSQRELYGIMNTMLEVSGSNVFARNAVGISHFNTLANQAGLSSTWRYKEGLSIYDNTHKWATEWEGIGEKGVLDFLSKMHSVAVKASQEIAIGASFSKEFGKAVREPGYVKLAWTNQTKAQKQTSGFYNLIDHDLYYPKDIASQVIQVDKLMRESRSLDTSKPFGKFIVNVFDPITNALKASQTTVRPGHWTISISGDLLRNQVAGVNSIMPYRHAVGIMRSGGIDTADFIGKIDSAEMIARYRKSQEVAQGFEASSTGKGVTMFVGGKKANVSYETMEKILHDVVMLPKHRGGGGVVEDRFIGENVTNQLSRKLEKATDAVTDNKYFSLNALAAKRDNFMRISLAVDFASKRKWDSLTDMKKGMEEYVTKWAPISTDMTSFESKYARRSMLYYTWLRGITPRIIDSAMTKPGVTTMVPKALYNVAYANGLNPESIGNPFPEDEGLFPGYYYNNVLGPQWKDDHGLWGINPSSPVIEVANTFKNLKPGTPVENAFGVGKQLIGMSTPFAKMPLELSMGANSTGIPIEDPAQYVGDNLGGAYLSTLSRATGKTFNQNGIVNRTDSAYKGDPELQAEHAKLQGINFLTGAKLTDYQSDSAIKSANYEAVEKMKREAEAQMRKQ